MRALLVVALMLFGVVTSQEPKQGGQGKGQDKGEQQGGEHNK